MILIAAREFEGWSMARLGRGSRYWVRSPYWPGTLPFTMHQLASYRRASKLVSARVGASLPERLRERWGDLLVEPLRGVGSEAA